MKNELNKVFITLKELGELRIADVFIFFDYPRTFLCLDRLNNKFLFTEISDDGDSSKFLIVQISNNRHFSLYHNSITLRDCFIKSENNIYMILDYNFNNNEYNLIYEVECPVNKIFSGDFYLNKQIDENENTHNILEESIECGSPLIDIVVNKNLTCTEGIESSLMENICSTSRIYLSSIYGRPISPLISTQKGSFVVRLNLNEPSNLFDNEDSVRTINTFNNTISNKDANEIYTALGGDNKKARKYLNFLSSLEKLNKDIQIISATPSDQKPQILNLPQDSIIASKNQISSLIGEKTLDISAEGKLIAFSGSNHTFTIKTDNGEIKGDYEPSIYNGEDIYGINKKVKVSLTKTIFLNQDGSESKRKNKYLLTKLEFLDEEK